MQAFQPQLADDVSHAVLPGDRMIESTSLIGNLWMLGVSRNFQLMYSVESDKRPPVEFDPSSPPFWEKDRGSGPVSDVAKSRKKLSGRFMLMDRLEKIREGIDRIKARLEQPCWPTEYSECKARIKRLENIQDRLRVRIWGKRVNGADEEVWYDERVRINGADGNGNRWVGRGIRL